MKAGTALQKAALQALRASGGMGVFEAPPVQAVFPYALVETGPETDWGHKGGEGREVRLAVTIRDEGERAERLQDLAQAAEAALEGMEATLPGWRLVTIRFARS